jgi:pilus assembly protein CpaF
VEQSRNILISDGTSSGKNTLLTALAAFISDQDRLVLIKDTSEVQMTKPSLVRFEEWRERPGVPAVTIRDLLRRR